MKRDRAAQQQAEKDADPSCRRGTAEAETAVEREREE